MGSVSIGLPVYQAERYLPEALDSVLRQSYEDFELVISDNASSDGTEEICRGYAARDGRIRYSRTAVNRGIAWNFNQVVHLSTGDLFKWMSHDDRWHPQMLELSLGVASEAPPGVVLWYPKTVFIDEEGRVTGPYDDRLDLRDPSPAVRLEQLLVNLRRCNAVFGLMPRGRLLSTRLMGAYPRADRVLLAELVLRGQFWELPEELFFRRMHPAGSTFANTNAGERRRFWDPSRRGEVFTLPRWQVAIEHLRAIQHAPLTSEERRSAHMAVLRHYGFRDRDVLVNDLKSLVYRVGDAIR